MPKTLSALAQEVDRLEKKAKLFHILAYNCFTEDGKLTELGISILTTFGREGYRDKVIPLFIDSQMSSIFQENTRTKEWEKAAYLSVNNFYLG